jgi:transposase
VCDNYGTHKHPAVRAWLARNPRITLHFTPTSGSWLNMVEIFSGIRVIWRKLDCLNPNLQKMQRSHPPERRLKPAPCPALAEYVS